MNDRIESIHDLTEDELRILAALRDPVKGEKMFDMMLRYFDETPFA